MSDLMLAKKTENIILHIGTNDLTNNIDTIPNLNSIFDYIISENVRPIFSEILIRHDKPNIANRVHTLNKKIQALCKSRNIRYLEHKEINDTCLSRKKLHLNQKGESTLAQSIKNISPLEIRTRFLHHRKPITKIRLKLPLLTNKM